MSGPDAVKVVRTHYPDIKALSMSGYNHVLLPDMSVAGFVEFIQKPFTPQAIAEKVREVLDG